MVINRRKKDKKQSEFSCIFKVFFAIPTDIVDYYYTTIYILTLTSVGLWSFDFGGGPKN